MMDHLELSPRSWARMAGAFYLITIVAGVFAEVLVRGAVVVRNDPAATAANILANDLLYRAGIVADLVMIVSYIVVTLALYHVLKPVGRNLSRLAACLSLLGLAVLSVNVLNHVAPLILLEGGEHLGAFDAAELQTLALVALKLHARGYSIAGVFFGAYCIMIGQLVYRSGFLPRALGLLMAAGGVSYLAHSVATFVFPALAARMPNVMVLGGIGELSLCLWLLARGVDDAQWHEKAGAWRTNG